MPSSETQTDNPRLAVLLPCYNEAMTIGKVIADFKIALPEAKIYVYDNNSTDASFDIAATGGAIVRKVSQQGKGFVIRRMFREIDADCYVLADSDDTYPAEEAPKLITPILNGTAEMVIGDRLSTTYKSQNKRPGHSFGNALVCILIRLLWGTPVHDVMTGFRAFSRHFAKTYPVLSCGFEVETEMTLHTIDKRLPFWEMPIQYRDRPKGSLSKLHTFRDGMRVLRTIFNLFRYYRPLLFYTGIFVILSLVALGLFTPVFIDFLKTGLVPRLPTLITAGFIMVSALFSLVTGLILDALKRHTDQMFEMISALPDTPRGGRGVAFSAPREK